MLRVTSLVTRPVIGKLSTNPAKALKLDKGTLSVGTAADVTIIDPKVTWKVDSNQFASLSTNTPFNELTLTGRAETVIVDGTIKLQR